VKDGVNYDLQPWLGGFVEKVGLSKAKWLLEGTGQIGDWRHPNDEGKHLRQKQFKLKK